MRHRFISISLILAVAGCANVPSEKPGHLVTAKPKPAAVAAESAREGNPPEAGSKQSSRSYDATAEALDAPSAMTTATTTSAIRNLRAATAGSAEAPAGPAHPIRNRTYALAARRFSAPKTAAEQPKPAEMAPTNTESAKYPDGNAAYYVPKQMEQDQASTVELWIDRRVSVGELQAALARQLKVSADHIKTRLGQTPGAGGEIVAGDVQGLSDVRIGEKMFAQLHGGEDFDIDPKEPVPGDLKQNERVMWNWRIKPKRYSTDGLLLIIEVWVDPGPGRGTIPSIEERVIVTAPEKSFTDRLKALQELLDSIDQIYKILAGLGLFGGIAIGFRKLWRRLRHK